MSISARNPFKGRQYSGDVILTAVRWYLRYPLAYQHVSDLLAERDWLWTPAASGAGCKPMPQTGVPCCVDSRCNQYSNPAGLPHPRNTDQALCYESVNLDGSYPVLAMLVAGLLSSVLAAFGRKASRLLLIGDCLFAMSRTAGCLDALC